MAKRLYVGNLPYSFDDKQLADLFSKYGTVASAVVIMDRATNRSKGFGFVEYEEGEEGDKAAEAAMKELHESEQEGRKIIVNEARPREERPAGGGYNRN